MIKLIKKDLFIVFALVIVLMSMGYGSKNVMAKLLTDTKSKNTDTSGSISLSESSVSLDLNGTRFKSVIVSDQYGKSRRYRYEAPENDGYATLSWGDWNSDGTCPLTITGQKTGSFQLRVNLLDGETGNVVASTNWITVTVHSTTSSIPNQDPFCTTCGGLGDCPECFGSGHRDCTALHCLGGMCLECSGTGTILSYYVGAGTKERKCTYCHGSGFCSRCGGDGYLDCTYCNGSGNCYTCRGTGYK